MKSLNLRLSPEEYLLITDFAARDSRSVSSAIRVLISRGLAAPAHPAHPAHPHTAYTPAHPAHPAHPHTAYTPAQPAPLQSPTEPEILQLPFAAQAKLFQQAINAGQSAATAARAHGVSREYVQGVLDKQARIDKAKNADAAAATSQLCDLHGQKLQYPVGGLPEGVTLRDIYSVVSHEADRVGGLLTTMRRQWAHSPPAAADLRDLLLDTMSTATRLPGALMLSPTEALCTALGVSRDELLAASGISDATWSALEARFADAYRARQEQSARENAEWKAARDAKKHTHSRTIDPELTAKLNSLFDE